MTILKKRSTLAALALLALSALAPVGTPTQAEYSFPTFPGGECVTTYESVGNGYCVTIECKVGRSWEVVDYYCVGVF